CQYTTSYDDMNSLQIYILTSYECLLLLPNQHIVCQLELTQDGIILLLLLLKLLLHAARLISDLIHLTVEDLLPLSQFFHVSPDLQKELVTGSELIEMLSVI